MEYPGGVINLRTLSVVLELLWTLIFKFLEALFSTYISAILILPIATVAGVINEIFRFIISQRLKWNYDGRYELVPSAADSIWSIKKAGNSKNILLLTIFDDIIDLKTYKYEFHRRVLNYKDANGNCPYGKLRKIFTQAFGYCCWRMDENFCIDRHFRMLEPRDNIKPFFTESDLPRILSEMTEDMSQEHPQWEEIILSFVYNKDLNFNDRSSSGTRNDGSGENIYTLKPGGKLRSAKIFRFHHAYMDQISAMAMMKACWMTKFEDKDGPKEGSATTTTGSDGCCSLLENVKELLYLIAFGSSRYIKSWMEESSCFSQFSLPQFSGKKIHSWSAAIEMEVLRGIQHHTNCSVAEILTSALGGSLRFVSEKCCKKPEWLIFCDTFEDSVFLGMPCPIVPFPVDCPVNKIGMAGFLLNTEALTSTLDRLHSVRDTYRQNVTNSPTSQLHYWLKSFLGRFPSRVIQYFLVESGAPVVFHYYGTMTGEELGSNSTIKVMGSPVEEIDFWMPLVTCTGLNVSVCQYSDHIRVCGVGESSRVSAQELDFILRQMNQEIIQMAEECGLKVNNSDFVTL